MPKDRFAEFAAEQELEPGAMISFQAPDGELPGVVTQVFSEAVEVDFNHPLSGNDVIFDVSILSVEDPIAIEA